MRPACAEGDARRCASLICRMLPAELAKATWATVQALQPARVEHKVTAILGGIVR